MNFMQREKSRRMEALRNPVPECAKSYEVEQRILEEKSEARARMGVGTGKAKWWGKA